MKEIDNIRNRLKSTLEELENRGMKYNCIWDSIIATLEDIDIIERENKIISMEIANNLLQKSEFIKLLQDEKCMEKAEK